MAATSGGTYMTPNNFEIFMVIFIRILSLHEIEIGIRILCPQSLFGKNDVWN